MRVPIMLALAGLSMTAQATEPQTMTLSCKGTMTGYGTTDPLPLSSILSLDFMTGTVETSGAPFRNGGKITQVTELTVSLSDNEMKIRCYNRQLGPDYRGFRGERSNL
jgi:hypothetical protein